MGEEGKLLIESLEKHSLPQHPVTDMYKPMLIKGGSMAITLYKFLWYRVIIDGVKKIKRKTQMAASIVK